MENYLNLKKQLELAMIHLEALLEQKKILNSFLYPKTFKINPTPPNRGGKNSDPFAIYTFQMTNIDKQINIVQREINMLKKNIAKMDLILRDIDNNTYKIFVYRYLDGLSVENIAKKTNFSTRRIYQILNKIESKLSS